MKLLVAIPTVNVTRASAMLGMINENSHYPDNVLIMSANIHAGECLTKPRAINRRTVVLVDETITGVNPQWNRAIHEVITGDFDALLLLNDDVLISPLFFSIMFENMNKLGPFGVLCPKVTTNERRYMRFTEDVHTSPTRIVGPKLYGCAFIMSKPFLVQCPEIPDELQYFYGDDWIEFWCRKLNYCLAQTTDTLIYHEVGGTTYTATEKFRAIRAAEGKQYKSIMKGYTP